MRKKTRERRKPGRRTPPPESTGNERRYWEELLHAGAALTVHLDGGRTVSGRLVETQEHSVGIAGEGAEVQLIRKAEIRFVEGP